MKTLARLLISLTIIASTLCWSDCPAQTFTLEKDASVIGAAAPFTIHTTQKEDSLIEMARHYDLGFNEIELANPGLDVFVPGVDKAVRIPAAWVLPDTPMDGIVVNLSEMRLYFYHPAAKDGHRKVSTFPIGIGDEGLDTPVGSFKIVEKIPNPAWHPPKSIRIERPELPAVVPPGPDNPLGTHALRLSLRSYLIHGTNRPFAIGRRATHGCMRIYPEDIPKLFEMVPNGTKVSIVKQPVKVGLRNNKVFVEIHVDEDVKIPNYFEATTALLQKKGLLKKISTEKLYRAIRKKDGVPFDITLDNKKEGPKTPVAPDFWTL